jgi:Icc-related predicted phosphoesterase
MRVHVVSDVHGRADALRRAGDGADALLCLGDLLLFIDYQDAHGGIMADLFGADAVTTMVSLRNARRFDEARQFSRSLWAGISGGPEETAAIMQRAVRAQYQELFDAFPTPTYLTYGNVDLPELLREQLRPGITLLDGQVVELGGRSVGFVGGGLPTPMHTPYEISEEEYAAKVEAVGDVDVLCCHIPPDLPDLVYDTVAQRAERGSAAILAAIHRMSPQYVLFGHVHQPRVSRVRVGSTECINVGHFRATGAPFILNW